MSINKKNHLAEIRRTLQLAIPVIVGMVASFSMNFVDTVMSGRLPERDVALAALGIGGAVWSADLVVTDTDRDTCAQLVTNLSYSWIWGGKNVSGVVEYFFNGFGQPDGQYDPDRLAQNPELIRRLDARTVDALTRFD